MVKVNEARSEARRGQILDAALACFAREGFHQTTMADIAREAGISAGAIYRHFRSKDDVIKASTEARREVRAKFFEKATQKADTLSVLDEAIDHYYQKADQPNDSMRLGVQLFAEALRNDRVRRSLRSSWDDVLAHFAEIIRRAQANGEINPVLDPFTVALLLVAATEGLVVHKSVDPDVDVWKYAEVLKALYSGDFWRGVKPASRGKKVVSSRSFKSKNVGFHVNRSSAAGRRLRKSGGQTERSGVQR